MLFLSLWRSRYTIFLLALFTILVMLYNSGSVLNLNPAPTGHQRHGLGSPNTTLVLHSEQILGSPNTTLVIHSEHILNMGFPKTGSSSLHKFLQCGGIYSSHYNCGSKQKKCGICIRNNIKSSLPAFQGCGSYTAWSQMDITFIDKNNPDICYFPQVDAMDELHQAYPNATWILPHRPIQDWLRSLQKWNNFDKRIQHCEFETRERVDDLEAFWHEHVAAVRSFVKDHPSHRLVEYNISNPAALFSAFPSIKRTCWTQSNVRASAAQQPPGS